jgi:hypothetical protein
MAKWLILVVLAVAAFQSSSATPFRFRKGTGGYTPDPAAFKAKKEADCLKFNGKKSPADGDFFWLEAEKRCVSKFKIGATFNNDEGACNAVNKAAGGKLLPKLNNKITEKDRATLNEKIMELGHDMGEKNDKLMKQYTQRRTMFFKFGKKGAACFNANIYREWGETYGEYEPHYHRSYYYRMWEHSDMDGHMNPHYWMGCEGEGNQPKCQYHGQIVYMGPDFKGNPFQTCIWENDNNVYQAQAIQACREGKPMEGGKKKECPPAPGSKKCVLYKDLPDAEKAKIDALVTKDTTLKTPATPKGFPLTNGDIIQKRFETKNPIPWLPFDPQKLPQNPYDDDYSRLSPENKAAWAKIAGK